MHSVQDHELKSLISASDDTVWAQWFLGIAIGAEVSLLLIWVVATLAPSMHGIFSGVAIALAAIIIWSLRAYMKGRKAVKSLCTGIEARTQGAEIIPLVKNRTAESGQGHE